MIDIAHCKSTNCPLYDKCYRNPRDKRIDMLQVNIAPEFTDKGCELFITIEPWTLKKPTAGEEPPQP